VFTFILFSIVELFRLINLANLLIVQLDSNDTAVLTLHGNCIFSCPGLLVDPTDFGKVNPPTRPGRVKHGRRGIYIYIHASTQQHDTPWPHLITDDGLE